jgi:hypothetical protein
MQICAQFHAQTALTRQYSSCNHRIGGLVGLTALTFTLVVQVVESGLRMWLQVREFKWGLSLNK